MSASPPVDLTTADSQVRYRSIIKSIDDTLELFNADSEPNLVDKSNPTKPFDTETVNERGWTAFKRSSDAGIRTAAPTEAANNNTLAAAAEGSDSEDADIDPSEWTSGHKRRAGVLKAAAALGKKLSKAEEARRRAAEIKEASEKKKGKGKKKGFGEG